MLRFILISALASLALAGVPRDINSLLELDGRIVGGRDAEIEEFPYQISLEVGGWHNCGGSIVSETVVVTAAHCVGGSASSYRVRAGTSIEGSGGQVVQVKEVKRNPKYNPSITDNDSAVLILAEPLIFGSTVQAVPLAEDDQEVPAGAKSVVTGWGAIRQGGPSPSKLQAVEVPIVSKEECSEAYKGSRPITDAMICAGLTSGGKDSCQGDSGGPLVIDGVLTGIVSWGRGCAQPKYPGVYASIPNQRAFIREASGV